MPEPKQDKISIYESSMAMSASGNVCLAWSPNPKGRLWGGKKHFYCLSTHRKGHADLEMLCHILTHPHIEKASMDLCKKNQCRLHQSGKGQKPKRSVHDVTNRSGNDGETCASAELTRVAFRGRGRPRLGARHMGLPIYHRMAIMVRGRQHLTLPQSSWTVQCNAV